MGDLSVEERQEHFQLQAVNEGRKVDDIALRVLGEAGFTIDRKARVKPAGLDFTYLVTADDGVVTQWYIDVVGAFTSSHPGSLLTLRSRGGYCAG